MTPSIVDYRPRSTLVAERHLVPKAKFPAIDFHGHPEGLLGSADGVARLVAALDSLNLRLMVSADNLSGDRLQRTLAVVQSSPHKDRVRVLAYDYSTDAPGPIAPLDWVQQAIDGTAKASGDPAKLVMTALMWVGRLEVIPVLLLFTRHYWRN